MRDVTPCVGVWIETWNGENAFVFGESHPAWVCGLKHYVISEESLPGGSHPAWVCGLKHVCF